MADERDKFLKFLEAREVRADCEACGRNDWIIPTVAGGLMTVFPTYTSESTDFGKGIHVYLVVCKNCGNTRIHAAAVVEKDDKDG
jgi:uncharacterized OB-fold protein